jgi:hypothetical protein
MRMIRAGIVVVVLAGCASTEGLAPPQPATVAGGDGSVILTGEHQRWRHDPYELLTARVDGDTLHVTVQYAGGCATHEFALLVSPMFLESYPVQMSGSLAHDAGGDLCRGLMGSRLAFDLSPIKALYRESYGVHSDTVHLRIVGWPERVVYAF